MPQTLEIEKLDTLLIEKVDNGFILYENQDLHRDPSRCSAFRSRKVFNTKDQLKEFIDEKF
ncbi:hypothetical protein [uncultured Christiangramia sp.]|uniref:hypothetical protein n=1 Tax=uncultured Christiangramia sp. TaxID=503836 RepID=UPI00262F154F|nr:hypothetical protein [uncultured Christiangramia sp.]